MYFVTIISALLGAALAAPGRLQSSLGRNSVPDSDHGNAGLHPVSTANQPRAFQPTTVTYTSHGITYTEVSSWGNRQNKD